MFPPFQLILKMDLFALNDRITDKCPAVQIFPFHVNCGDLMIFVSGVVVDALGGIAAGCVECELIFAVCNFTAASLLVNGAKDMEKLADAFQFGIAGSCVHSGKGDSDKAGSRRKVARKSECPHAAAVGGKCQIVSKSIGRLFRRQMHVVV